MTGYDETAFRKRHDYVTNVSDQSTGTVLHVGEDRKKSRLKNWHERAPGAEEKVAFDKFHVAKYLGEAVDKVRRQEHKALMAEGYENLKGTRYDWL